MPHQITRHSARDALNVRVFCCPEKGCVRSFLQCPQPSAWYLDHPWNL